MTAVAAFASPIDAFAFGEYRSPAIVAAPFEGRVTTDGSSGFAAQAGRYHLYTAPTSTASHRIEILRELAGLADVVSLSRVDGLRDGRGWAFRENTGPDPENGFTLLREAYEASRPGYAGDVSVPVLWDSERCCIVSTAATAIGIDLLTQFGAPDGRSLYPIQLAGEIERVSAMVVSSISGVLARAVYDRHAAGEVRAALWRLDGKLADRRRLLGDALTDADVRLWVNLVRYDVGVNAHGAIGPALSAYPRVWRYARDLYELPAFRSTTDFGAFAAPFAELDRWRAPAA